MVRCRRSTCCIRSTLKPSLLVIGTKKRGVYLFDVLVYICKHTGYCVVCFSISVSMLYLGDISFKFGGFLKEWKEYVGYYLEELYSGNKKICHSTS